MLPDKELTENRPRRTDASSNAPVTVFFILLVVAYGVWTLWSAHTFALPTGKDEAWHLYNLERLVEATRWSHPPATVAAYADIFLDADFRYPPLRYLIALPFRFALAGLDGPYSAAVAANFLFIAVLVFAFYALCRPALPSVAAAMLTTALLLSVPLAGHSRQFTLTYPTAALTVAYLAVLVRRPVFLRARATLLLAVLVVLGTDVYYLFPAYVFAPSILIFAVALYRNPERRRKVLVHGALATLGVTVALGLYYLRPEVARFFPNEGSQFLVTDPERLGRPSAWTVVGNLGRAIAWYATAAVDRHGFWVAPLAVMLSGWKGLRKNPATPAALAAIAGTMALFGVFSAKDAGYVIPLIPCAYLLVAAAVSGFGPRWRLTATTIVLLASLISFVTESRERSSLARSTVIDTLGPMTAECASRPPRENAVEGADPPCRVVWTDCQSEHNDVVIAWVTGHLPERWWTWYPLDPGFSLDRADYVIVDFWNIRDVLDRYYRGLDATQIPTVARCPINASFRADAPGFVLTDAGRDVTDDFEFVSGVIDARQPMFVLVRKSGDAASDVTPAALVAVPADSE